MGGYEAASAVVHRWALMSSATSPLPFASSMPYHATSAATPATWGEAIEVPLMAEYPFGEQNVHDPTGTVETIWSPGAARSTCGPVHE